MNNYFKLSVIVLTMAISAMFASVSVAAEVMRATCDAGAYGVLEGQLFNPTSLSAEVDYNPDRAYLKIKCDIVNSAGTTILSDSHRGEDGRTGLSWMFERPDGAYRTYGAHAVQGGSVNRAYAVYTTMSAERG